MTTFKLKGLIILLTAFMVMMLGGHALAGTMAIGNERLNFILDDVTGVFNQNSGTPDEIAVPFKFYFDPDPGMTDPIPTGTVSKVWIRLDYSESRPNIYYTDYDLEEAGWTVTYLQAHDPGNGIVAMELTGASGMPIPTDSENPAHYISLKFMAGCQPELSNNPILFVQNSDLNYVDTYDEGTSSWGPGDYEDGSLTTADYQVDFDIENKSALLGDQNIRVEIRGTTNCNLNGFLHKIVFDDDYLTYVGYERNTELLPEGYSAYNDPVIEGNTFTYDYIAAPANPPPILPQTEEVWFYALYFNLDPSIGDNNSAYINFDAENSWAYVYYFCQELFGVGTYENGDIHVPRYLAELKSELQGDFIVKDEPITFDISIKNNFPLGDYSTINDNGALSIVYTWPDIFEYPDQAGDDLLDPLTFDGVFHTNGDKVYFTYQVFDATRTDNFIPPAEDFVHLLTLECDMDLAEFEPEYELRTVTLDFRNSYVDAYNSWYTQAEDTSGFGNAEAVQSEFIYEEVEAEIKMGRFYAAYSSSGNTYVDQSLYIAANFDIGQFSVNVKLLPDDDMRITGVTPEFPLGVSYETIDNREVRVFYSGSGMFHEATGPGIVKIATIHYRAVCNGAGKVGEYIPGDGSYYEYGHVSLVNEWINDIASPAHGHYVDVDPNIVKGKCADPNVVDTAVVHELDRKESAGTMPTEFALYPNSPNPFNPQTLIAYDIPAAANVKVEVINILGQRITTLVDEFKAPGHYEIMWNGTDQYGSKVASGIYLYYMQAGDYIETRKMMLMK